MRISKAEQKRITIERLTGIARTHFSEKGYAEANTEEMVLEAGLTRGALYHHFGSKEGLFHAVLEAVQEEIAERVEAEAATGDEPWRQLLLGCRAFIAAAVEPRNRRILLVDGPAVLGWDAWREMDERNSMNELREQLELMRDQGLLKPVSIPALTHLLSGAMNEAALWLAQSPDPDSALEETTAAIALMLEGFRST